MSQSKPSQTRRDFLKTTAAGTTAAFLGAPAIHAGTKTDSRIVLGSGDYQYEVTHNWAKLPSKFSWQITHNVAVDKDGFLYVIHEGDAKQTDHPSIFVFDPKGNYVRSFGKQFQGGGHGLEVRQEGNEQFIYVTGYQHLKTFAKLDLKGETVWQKYAPMESKLYAAGEATNPKKVWGQDRFMPTNFAFHPDGGFYLADGYGAYHVHRYDKNGKWLSAFGGKGKEDGQFRLPHGLWIDDREGRAPSVVVADRANGRVQWFTLDGKHLKTMTDFILPANVDAHKEVLLVPDLASRITLLDAKDNVISHLGQDPDWDKAMKAAKKPRMREQPDKWQAGRFVHPHDACFDQEGNIFVAEWVATGRITKLKRLG
ncbi:MAG: twin-arginine translocation signal domain-containing protein [Planctomycetes bacterium]|nr:twin-arginine translocation signal domain-containing protein [Planctomycetota bacterium]MCH9778724.1 twin-arginine translocation signal domain-containing protein [Planctomycetota bacterium]MCH9791277.1 twin-arginine translocation signal domain-containing protein [Planctomycetota bacterium]